MLPCAIHGASVGKRPSRRTAMPDSSRSRVRLNLDRFGEARAVVDVSPAVIRLFVRDRVMVSGR